MGNFGGLFHFAVWGVYCLRGLRCWFAFAIDGLGLIVRVLYIVFLCLIVYFCYYFGYTCVIGCGFSFGYFGIGLSAVFRVVWLLACVIGFGILVLRWFDYILVVCLGL